MGQLSVGASGQLGVALEAVSGTYVAPQQYVPFNSNSLQYVQDTNFRRPVRKSPDQVWAVPGNSRVEGDIEMDCLDEVLPYFMYASRMTVVKTGSSPNFTYTGTASDVAIPAKTMSITVERAGEVFGYVGCVVSSFTFTIEDGVLMYNVSILGTDEASQSVPTPTWPTATPFGAGQYSIQIPTASPVTDTDNFEFSVEDNGTAEYRLKTPGRGAQFIRFGERTVSTQVSRDFTSRTEYDAYKALTAQSVTISATKTVNNSVTILVPSTIKDTYEIEGNTQGDMVRANVTYQHILPSSGAVYTLTCKTQEEITP
jgi:hypothetical protein